MTQGAQDLVAERIAGMLRRGDLRLTREREGELDGVPRAGALDRDRDAAAGQGPRAGTVALRGPGRGRGREAQRDGVLAPAGEEELRALEPRRVQWPGVRESVAGLADRKNAVDAKGALRGSPGILADR